jgi:hypothetical protein
MLQKQIKAKSVFYIDKALFVLTTWAVYNYSRHAVSTICMYELPGLRPEC